MFLCFGIKNAGENPAFFHYLHLMLRFGAAFALLLEALQ